MYMPDAFFGMTMTSPWLYSLLYNGFYMLIDTLLCLVIFALLFRPMHQYLTGRRTCGKQRNNKKKPPAEPSAGGFLQGETPSVTGLRWRGKAAGWRDAGAGTERG